MHRQTLKHSLLVVVSASEKNAGDLERSSEEITLISEEWVEQVEQELISPKLQSVRPPGKGTNSIQIVISQIY